MPDEQLRVSQSLMMMVNAQGQMTALASMSHPPLTLTPAQWWLVGSLRSACPKEDVLAIPSTFSRAQLDEALDTLLAHSVVVPVKGTQVDSSRYVLGPGGWADIAEHHRMLYDTVRVHAYRSSLFRHARDQVVLDIGTGTGLLAILAAKAGARHVYAIEESAIAEVALEMYAENGVADRITLLQGNSRDIELPQRANVIVHELLNTDPFGENLLPAIQHATQHFLAPGGRLIPHRIEAMCVGVQMTEPVSSGQRMLREAENLNDFYGLSFKPVLKRMQAAFDVAGPNFDQGGMVIPPTAPQTLLTRPCLLRDVQLDGDLTEAMNEQSVESVLEVNAPGILGGVAIYFRAHMDEHTVLSTSPSAPPTCWGFQVKEFKERVQVQPGDRVRIVSTLNRSHGHRFKIVLA
ncbi:MULTISPECIES: 50S ribosomal protein L11 methyltransferase [Myxococcus]|uniref:Protein arginine N-methyltransferase domain-containing protein n=1 Tax=Myxococcus llanfairpwllgwyngyllgogerychwyrndrobwllllantysiliogogogochensis TaxID=2590453 RepID=A0A540X052_9BACT|nr:MULTISPECIES: 50S ribosomal protein L11 methyltransferase [Myxococcus]NTX04719.1 50S ribosomal protein L11 methyltransferase [Myxococcus sp. CA040A]TQF14637.1 hypothetical protein FJV41_17765 [Myxococcus llanfairpwllgwyngyllgogerychwyrndrobwllllantysiliogogogochensis]